MRKAEKSTFMPRTGVLPRINPFSTRFTAPGTIPFRFPPGESPASLAARLDETGGWGQIIGPHGSGKSSLLAALLPALSAWQIRHVRLNSTHRLLPPSTWDPSGPRGLIIIDGFEQLGFVSRRRVKHHCRRAGCGLLVTAHSSMGLPELHRTDVTPMTAADVIRSLVPPGGGWVLDDYDIAARLRRHRGSLRDVLFELYDRWEEGGAFAKGIRSMPVR
jgi:hypothetical protein